MWRKSSHWPQWIIVLDVYWEVTGNAWSDKCVWLLNCCEISRGTMARKMCSGTMHIERSGNASVQGIGVDRDLWCNCSSKEGPGAAWRLLLNMYTERFPGSDSARDHFPSVYKPWEDQRNLTIMQGCLHVVCCGFSVEKWCTLCAVPEVCRWHSVVQSH